MAFDILTAKQRRRLAIYQTVIDLYDEVRKAVPYARGHIGIVVRTLNTSPDYADFRAKYPDAPMSFAGISNILKGRNKMQHALDALAKEGQKS
ncbi:MAG: hypothetical protein U0K36_01370 [Bacteroidales bacterium]|nr:hypothetical protein [Bacteroidales bacterium]